MIEHKKDLLEEILQNKRGVQEVADIFKVSRQSVNIWLRNYKRDGIHGIIPKKPGPKSGEAHNKTEDFLEDEICRLAQENYFEGPVWISDQIYDLYHMKIDQSTVYRILKRRGLRYYYGYHSIKKKRKLYVKDIPGRELQLDVSFPFGYQRKICIYTAIDDASRFVISEVCINHCEDTTLKFIQKVIEESKYRISAFRTDQGREFSKKVSIFLQKNLIDHHKNPPYTPQHNGKVERYHRTMKEKCCVYWKFDADISELRYSLKLWTDYYNTRKKHYGLGMNGKTPEEKLRIFKQINPLFVPLL